MSTLPEKIQELTDIELAILLSLVAGQHCIIQTEDDVAGSLVEELELIASNVFGLSHVVLNCNESTSLEDFSNGILIEKSRSHLSKDEEDQGGVDSSKISRLRPRPALSSSDSNQSMSSRYQDNRIIANIVIVRGLPLVYANIQIQALELLRTKRIFTHTAVYSAPKSFLLVIVNSTSDPRLVHHLNDHIFISHDHDPDDGFANLEDSSGWIDDDQESLSSVVHRSVGPPSGEKKIRTPAFPIEEIKALADLTENITLNIEIKGYLHNIVTFLRLHRAVSGGVTPTATRHLETLARQLAPAHGLEFVTPEMIALAARKIYRHRITIPAPESERSMQYGSDIHAVTAVLSQYDPETVVEETLDQVPIPI